MNANDNRETDRRDPPSATLSTAGWVILTGAVLMFAIGFMVTASASPEENVFAPAGLMWFVLAVLALLTAIAVWITVAVRAALRRFGRRD